MTKIIDNPFMVDPTFVGPDVIDKTFYECTYCYAYIGNEAVAVCDDCAESINEFNKQSDVLFFAGVEEPAL